MDDLTATQQSLTSISALIRENAEQIERNEAVFRRSYFWCQQDNDSPHDFPFRISSIKGKLHA